MISPDINNFSVSCRQPFHDEFEESGMSFFPFTWFAELPSIYYVPVQDEFVTGMVSEELHGFSCSWILDTQMYIREYDSAVVSLQGLEVLQI